MQLKLCCCLFSVAGWANENERRQYLAGEDALQLPDVIARLRADLALRLGRDTSETALSPLELPRLLIETYLLDGSQFPTREAVLAEALDATGGVWLP